MPRERTYTNAGYIEVQWSKEGQLICLVSGTVNNVGEDATETMHQFTERGEVGPFLRSLIRARKQSFPSSAEWLRHKLDEGLVD